MTLVSKHEAAVTHHVPPGAAAGPNSVQGAATDSVPADRLDLTVAGMTCGHCVTAVRGALDALPGVSVQQVGVGSASVTLEPQGASPSAVIDAIREAGYQATFASSASASTKSEPPHAPSGSSCCSTR